MQRRILALLRKTFDLPKGDYELTDIEPVTFHGKKSPIYPRDAFQINLTYKGVASLSGLPIHIVVSVNGKFDEEVDKLDIDFFFGPDFTDDYVFFMISGDLSSHDEAA
jgi:hypothetical protein